MSIEDKLAAYHLLADDIIEHIYNVDKIKHHCFKVKFAPIEDLIPNKYNPNTMPKLLMDLLKECVFDYGFLFCIITRFDAKLGKYIIIDGYHRYETFKRSNCKYAVFLELDVDACKAMLLTVLMNRIKGFHGVEKMSNLVVTLSDFGMTDNEIAQSLNMEAEELIRLKSQLGIAHSFRDANYSNSWEIEK